MYGPAAVLLTLTLWETEVISLMGRDAGNEDRATQVGITFASIPISLSRLTNAIKGNYVSFQLLDSPGAI